MPMSEKSDRQSGRPPRGSDARLLGRVLIAADDPDLRLYLRRGLADMAAEIVEATDGLEALQRLGPRPADLVIADAEMPRLDGLELAAVLAGRGVPVLLLDGVSRGRPPEAAVLEKPFDRRQLRCAVAKATVEEGDFET